MSIHFSDAARKYLDAHTVDPDQIDWMDQNGFGWTEDGNDYALSWSEIGDLDYAKLRELMDQEVPITYHDNGGLYADTIVDHAATPPQDPVNHPDYYVMPNGAELLHITQWLNGSGAQAVQYIVRSTRIDGVVKESPIEDIDKAIFWLNVERKRLAGKESPGAH